MPREEPPTYHGSELVIARKRTLARLARAHGWRASAVVLEREAEALERRMRRQRVEAN
jgi:hypothetical protein